MILEMARRLKDIGILGMNHRNAEYIMRCNPRSFFPLVDDKVLTKELALKHGIPTPPVYYIIENHAAIARFEKAATQIESFVIKPARGSGGSGITLVMGRVAGGFVKQDGTVIPREEFNYYISDILSGIYSLGGLEDKAIVEGLVQPDPVFEAITYKGVPDIRIIVYRGVPVMSMVRLPTRASDGKANIHRGALGAGIDIGTGVTVSAVHHSGMVTHHPDTGNPVKGVQVPYWEMMLLMAAKALDMTGLGYLGVDLIIDRDRGPVLLELNARPGLQIQVANGAGLRHRLELVDAVWSGLLKSPEGRVEWAMKTFTA